MKTFSQFMTLCEDRKASGGTYAGQAGWGGGASVIKGGAPGERITNYRKKTPAEMRRTKRTGGGESKPSSYKPRKDIGDQRDTSVRVQQPEKERGSKEVAQSYAEKVKAERKAAAKARAAGASTTKAKPTENQLKKQGSKLLSTKAAEKPKATPSASDERFASSRKPSDHQIKGKYTRAEKKQVVRAGKQKLRDLVLAASGKKKESELKNKYTGPDKD